MYKREDVFKETLKYFNGDELATNVWIDKYALKDSEGNLYELSPDDMHKRLASEFARIESNYPNPMSEEKIYSLFRGFKYIVPQGSPMFGVGNNFSLSSLSNCYVVGTNNDSDSYGSIMRTDEEIAQIYKRRGGCGLTLDHYRPIGSVANGSRLNEDAGSTLYMERFSNTTKEVSQSKRRGALMETMSTKHPDVETFIDKKIDTSKVTGANISVKIDDEFMESVINKKDYVQTFPINLKPYDTCLVGFNEDFKALEYNKLYSLSKHCHAKKIKACKLWDKIIHNAWKSAEPGVLFWDNVLKESPAGSYGKDWKEISTNPCCFSVDSRVDVVTDKGIKDIRNITSNDKVWLQNENKFVETSGYFSTGKAEVFEVEFNNGDVLEITENHKLAKIKPKRVGAKINKDDFSLIKLKYLSVGDEIRIHNSESRSFGDLGNYDDGIILGWLSGDGCLSYKNKDDRFPSMILDFWQGEHDIVGIYEKAINKLGVKIKPHKMVNKGNDVIRFCSSRLTNHYTDKFEENIWNFRKGKINMLYNASEEFIRGYLAAYFTADGTVQDVIRQSRFNVSVSSINKERLYQVQSLLLNFGIKSSIGLMKKQGSGRGEFKNSKDCFRLTITGISNIIKFKKYIGFLNKNKQDKLEHICGLNIEKEKSLSYTKIKSIVSLGVKETGCIEVPKYHYFTANSIISGNSELPLCEYDSCRLIAINLYPYVENPFTKESKFNFILFREHVVMAQRLMDDLIDLEIEKLNSIIEKIKSDSESEDIKKVELELWEKIRNKAIEGRRTGLGITAEGDMLAALNIRYGTKEAIDFSEKIHKQMAMSSYESSINMAKERGSFPIWDYEKERRNPFVKRVILDMNIDPQFDYRKYGRRNIANLTIAPTGSVSILTQTTSGIEPVFKVYYKRRKKTDDPKKCVFTDETGDMWEEFPVFHHKFIEWFKINKWDEVEDHLGVDSPEKWLKECSDSILEKYVQESPYYKATSDDVDYLGKVEMQGKIQKWVDHSISVTVNMPENATEDMVSQVYMKAWKVGCKGITVYRDGSRSGVLVSKNKKEEVEDIIYNNAPKRPKKLKCDIYKITRGKIPYTILVGVTESGKPYEIFALEKEMKFNDKIEHGWLEKVRSKTYKLTGVRNDVTYTVDNIIDYLSEDEQKNTRKFSSILRHGMHPKYIIEQINTYTAITSFDKVIAKALSYYLAGETVKGEKICPSCGGVLKNESGCVVCLDCGWSKCG
jgi:ribonucleotide reductase alpha subunit